MRNSYIKFLPIVSIVTLGMVGCSPAIYRTNLSVIRDDYSKKSREIDNISTLRQQSIQEKETIFSKKIECLSNSWQKFALDNNERMKEYSIRTSRSAAENLVLHKVELEKILNGGYEYIERDISGKNILKYKKYNMGLYDLAQEVKILDTEINFYLKQNKSISQNFKKKMRELDAKARDLEFLKMRKTEVEKSIAQADAQRKKALSMLIPARSDGIQTTRIGTKFAVANIYDKTGKVYSPQSTALSEMVQHALSYNKAISVVDTPYGDAFNYSRYNPLHTKSLAKQHVEKSLNLLSNTYGFAGVVFPSDMYLSGALVEYDEQTVVKPYGTKVSINIDPLSLDSSTKTITIGLILRAVDSNNSVLQDNSLLKEKSVDDKSNKASVYLQNTFFVKKIGADVFEVKSKRLYGGKYGVEVADPINYAVREMIEDATYQVLKKTLPTEHQGFAKDCDSIKEI